MKAIFILLFVCLQTLLCAQTEYRSDYIVLKSGKKIEGEITYVGNRSLRMESDAWNKSKEVPLDNIIEYEIFNEKMPGSDGGLDFPRNENGIITYTEVVKMPGSTENVLYNAGLEWFVRVSESVENVLQIREGKTEKLIGKVTGRMCLRGGIVPKDVDFYCTVKIYFKEGRYKYEITDLFCAPVPDIHNISPAKFTAESVLINDLTNPSGRVDNLTAQYKSETVIAVRRLIKSMKKSLADVSAAAAEEDW